MWRERTWSGHWISAPDKWDLHRVSPAPWLRRTFHCESGLRQARAYLCGLGWHELYVNGRRIGNDVLTPVISQYDRHVLYREYDLSDVLVAGGNAVAVWLGNGNYNCNTAPECYRAPWRDVPKLLFDLEVDGRIVCRSDESWRVKSSPIVFDSMREGEHYDARLELAGFADPGLDDSDWLPAAPAWPAAGRVIRQEMEPCRVVQDIPMTARRKFGTERWVYDFGVNLSGWCVLKVRGPAGATVTLEYGESLAECGDLRHDEYSPVYPEGFQTDRYTLKGGGEECYEPRFTQHGFRYVRLNLSDAVVEIVDLTARFMHTDFIGCGEVHSSDPMLEKLQEITLRSYLGNYSGLPTDCPHREKNGWTGDAQLACETGLWNFDALRAYKHYIMTVFDTQRPSGQLCALAPSGGWAYNWGPGPAWDSVIFEIPWRLYLFYGDIELIETYYERMALYLEFCSGMAENGVVRFGLGDWSHPRPANMPEAAVTSTAYYYGDAVKMAFFARLLGRECDRAAYEAMATEIRRGFDAAFAHGDGDYAHGELTSLGTALYFGLAPEAIRATMAALLAERVRAGAHTADFGILGAKFVPRMLADYGYLDDAYTVLTQPELPGWGFWVRSGATTLWELWDGRASRNHIMFGDISAWMYEYPGGMRPDPEHPGFRHFFLEPRFPQALRTFSAAYRSRHGLIRTEWRREGNGLFGRCEIPSACTADLRLPDGTLQKGCTGAIEFMLQP